jgi:YD repeat-containing protein
VIAQNTGDARSLNAQYDKQGRLTAGLSGAGIATSYTYDADGRRTSVTDRNGARTLFYYDADGHLTHTIDALGEVTENKYNALGQVTRRIAYAGRLPGTTLAGLSGGLVNSALTNAIATIANAALDATTTYTYTLRGQVASATDPLGQSTTNYTYDADGDVVAKTEAVGKPEVRNTRYVYDRDDQLVYTVDASGGATKNEYDAQGRVARTIAYTTALSNFASLPATPTAIDVSSRLTVSPSDQILTHVYDRDGREVYTIDALGGVTQRIYDAEGNVLHRIGYAKTIPVATAATIAAVGAALVADPAHDNNARLVYDADNRLVYSIDGLGEVTRNDYDARDNVVRTTVYDKALTAAQLTGLGPNPTVANVQALVVANTGVDRVVQRVFDIDDRRVYTIDALGFVEKTDYDALGQAIRTTRYARRFRPARRRTCRSCSRACGQCKPSASAG